MSLLEEKEEIEFQAGALSRRFSEKAPIILPNNEVAQAMQLASTEKQALNYEQLWKSFLDDEVLPYT